MSITEEQAELYRAKYPKFCSVMEGNADIRENLIISSLFSIVLERFKKWSISTVDHFFASDFKGANGQLVLTRGDDFKELIRKYGKMENGKHTCRDFRACTYFFLELGYMTQEDVDTANKYYDERNNISHELYEIIAEDGKNGVYIDDILLLYTIYKNVVRNWIREVEATTGMIEPEDYDNCDFDNAETIETVVLWRMIESGLKDIPVWELIKEAIEASK